MEIRASAASRRTRDAVWIGAVAGTLGWVALFGLPHAALSVHFDRLACSRNGVMCAWNPAWKEYASNVAAAAVDYAGYALAGILLVIAGRRRLFAVPAAVGILAPGFLAAQPWSTYGGRFASVLWWPAQLRPGVPAPPQWFAHAWLGATLAFALALLPAAALALTRPKVAARRIAPAGVVGLVICTATILAAVCLLGPFELFRWGDASSTIVIAVVAAGVGLSRSWRSAVAIVTLPLLVVGLASQWATVLVWNGPLHPEIGIAGDLAGLIPWIALALVAASWEHAVQWLGRLAPLVDRPPAAGA